jgi:hypothetical protein
MMTAAVRLRIFSFLRLRAIMEEVIGIALSGSDDLRELSGASWQLLLVA